MSALSEAVPLALSAAFYPPAILVLILLLASEHPRRLVFAYFAGAALIVFSVGHRLPQRSRGHRRHAAGLHVGERRASRSRSASCSWRSAPGRGRGATARPPSPTPIRRRARIAQWSERATASARWAFALGIVMYLPSPMYLAAIKAIADSGDPTASQITAVLICGVCVMLFVEIPVIALLLRPDGLQRRLETMRDWLSANGWRLLAILALAAGVYALVKGIAAL